MSLSNHGSLQRASKKPGVGWPGECVLGPARFYFCKHMVFEKPCYYLADVVLYVP